MKPMPSPINEVLEDKVEHAALERVRRRVHATRRLGPERRWRWAPLAAAAVVLVALGVSVMFSSTTTEAGPLQLADGAPLGTLRGGDDGARYALSDGSAVQLAAGTSLYPLENGRERVVLVQGDGSAVYSVRPGGPRRWTIDVGAASVDVVGTRFDVARRGGRVGVGVQAGTVRVRGEAVEGGVRVLHAGERLDVGMSRTAAPTPTPDVAPDPRGSRVAPAPPSPRPAPTERWRQLASSGEYEGALEALGGVQPLQLRMERTRSPEELLELADTARYTGHPALAVAPLRRLVDEHPGDARAGLAALTLGRLLLDSLDQPDEAAGWLRRALELGVSEHLRAPTEARLVEAERRAGHLDRAREAATRYLADHPDGRDAPRLRRWLSE